MGDDNIPSRGWLDRRTLLSTGVTGLLGATSGCIAAFLGDSSSPPGIFYALDLSDGSTVWQQTIDNAVQSGAGVDGDTVYMGADDGFLRALSASDGSQQWAFDTAGPAFETDPDTAATAFVTTDVTVGAGGVYAGTDQAGILGVDAETGAQRFRFHLESPNTTQMVTTMSSTPAVTDGVVAFGTSNDQDLVYGVDAQTGEGLWELGTGGRVEGGPAAVDGRFYIVDNLGNVYAVSTAGDTLWEQEISGLTDGRPTVGNGRVYAGSDEGVHALDAETGEEVWVTTDTSHWVDSPPAIGETSVFAVSRSGTVTAVDPDSGSERWSTDVGAHARTAPALADGLVVAGDRNGGVTALHAEDGSERWAIDTEDPVTATPTIADGTVYIGTK